MAGSSLAGMERGPRPRTGRGATSWIPEPAAERLGRGHARLRRLPQLDAAVGPSVRRPDLPRWQSIGTRSTLPDGLLIKDPMESPPLTKLQPRPVEVCARPPGPPSPNLRRRSRYWGCCWSTPPEDSPNRSRLHRTPRARELDGMILGTILSDSLSIGRRRGWISDILDQILHGELSVVGVAVADFHAKLLHKQDPTRT